MLLHQGVQDGRHARRARRRAVVVRLQAQNPICLLLAKLAGLMRLAPKEDARQAYRRRRHIWPVVAICVETGIVPPVKA